jgi:hypothetical protein
MCLSQGRYLPLFAAAVYDQNPRLVEAGLTPINLTSVIIGVLGFQVPPLFVHFFPSKRGDRLRGHGVCLVSHIHKVDLRLE